MIFSKKYFIAQWLLNVFRYNTEHNTFLMSLIFSLLHNTQSVTYVAVVDCCFYSNHGLFSVKYELNVRLASLQSVNVTRTSFTVITP